MGCQRGLTGSPPMQPLATDSNFNAFNFAAARITVHPKIIAIEAALGEAEKTLKLSIDI